MYLRTTVDSRTVPGPLSLFRNLYIIKAIIHIMFGYMHTASYKYNISYHVYPKQMSRYHAIVYPYGPARALIRCHCNHTTFSHTYSETLMRHSVNTTFSIAE